MEYRNLGKSGVKVSAIGVGCNQIGSQVDRAGARALVHQALDVGINFFDTADTYGNRGRSEEYLGEALAGEWQRVVLATKVRSRMGDGPNDEGASRYHIASGVEASLRRLKTDHIDLYQIHAWDGSTPLEETLRALDDLVSAGKIRYAGASNFMAWQLCRANDLAERHGWAPMVTVQPHYHLLERGIERELAPYCRWAGIGILPYFPLAGGFLTGKYQRGAAPPSGSRGERSHYVQRYFTDANFAILDRLRPLAEAHGRGLGDLAVAWLLAQPQVASVIAGATRPEQIAANAQAATWVLTAEEQQEIRSIVGDPA
ncbi:MAG: aldo/keto reductase [Anaerolineales bacterium]|nr:aldo/keto reductase [Anaerolineales bacterium]